MTSREIACPSCRARFQCPAERFGKPVRCGSCSIVFTAPVPAATALPAKPVAAKPVLRAVEVPKPQPVSAAKVVATPRSVRPKDDEEDDDVAPRRRSAKTAPAANNTKLYIGLGAGAAALLMVGVLGVAVYALSGRTKTAVTEVVAAPPAEAPKPVVAPTVAPAPPVKQAEPQAVNAADAIKNVIASTVYIRVHSGRTLGMGSGFFAGDPGYIVTNSHVLGFGPETLRIPNKVEVVVRSGETDQLVYNARIVGLDVEEDLAILWVNEKDHGKPLPKPLSFGKTTDLVQTQEVLIFGFPLGEQLGLNISVNKSTISSLRKEKGVVEVVQVAGGMTNGNSGGPVTNTKGDVIGVSVAVIKGTQINFAIPSDRTSDFVRRQIASAGSFQLGRFAGQWQPNRR